jgi:hypothetical protein
VATRNLSRTIIEGGRGSRAQDNRKERVRKVRRMRFDAQGNLIGPEPRLSVDCLYHFDRLSPLRRWLRSNVGRPWAKVYSELCQRYDARTVKGWHLRDHVRSEVFPKFCQDRTDLYVDTHGVLRYRRLRFPYRWHRASVRRQEKAPHAWAGGRRVIVNGDALFWTADIVVTEKEPLFSRQGRRFTVDEAAYWNTLPEPVRVGLTYRPAAGSLSEDERERKGERRHRA